MVFLFRIDIPDIILILNTADDIFDRFKGRHHGVVYIVVAVLSVPADAVKVIDGFQIIYQRIDFLVSVELSRIRFFYSFYMEIHDIFWTVDQSHAEDFLYGKFGKLFIRHCPVLIAFRNKIFQSDPYGML